MRSLLLPCGSWQVTQLFETGANGLVPQNLDVARQLYTSAAARGLKEAAERLKIIGPANTPTPPAPSGSQATLAPTPPAARP